MNKYLFLFRNKKVHFIKTTREFPLKLHKNGDNRLILIRVYAIIIFASQTHVWWFRDFALIIKLKE